ncbi:hypothetical protein BX600DRAFT_433981 [Xylariales sp. PMI_506]|nr:hypothetical protein BX600DRAFT_433981 [Xylariales sp. PMI_506]
MASNSQPKPEVGDILVVIHDFTARSSDELSLSKGDRVELIERDDEFGDGWYLGRHLTNGNSGLFPEVYTRPAPKSVTAVATAPKSAPESSTTPTNETSVKLPIVSSATSSGEGRAEAAQPVVPKSNTTSPILPLNATKPEQPVTSPAVTTSISTPGPVSAPAPLVKSSTGPSVYNGLGHLSTQSRDSPVLHETLTVIDEHMNDLHSAPTSAALHSHGDSGSEYSANIQDRMSYIQGEETDEEEEGCHTREQVEAWTADDVAEYLFTLGVDKKHCEVFRDQEISGEVLLGMDQSSLFLKAFDLGSVGKRLKTWQKIKSLQDEVNGIGRTTQSYGSEAGSEAGSRRMRSRAGTLTNANTHQRLPSVAGSTHGRRASQTTPKLDATILGSPVSPKMLHESPTRPAHQKRPSAASVRDLHHSRRHSSTDHRLTGATLMGNTPKMMQSATFPSPDGGVVNHKKQPSFDRNWTMGGASTGSLSSRPLSSSGLHDFLGEELTVTQSPLDLDRGYFSGTEVDGRKRNTLKKRDTISVHSHKSSYTDEQRVRSATAMARHSRFGSMDSIQPEAPNASQKYYGFSNSLRRTTSTATTESARPAVPSKDNLPPTVTKLDEMELDGAGVSPLSTASRHDWLAKPAKMSGFGSLRAISDAVTGSERSKAAGDVLPKDSPVQSPSTRTASSTPSAGPSFELESPDANKSPLSSTTAGSQRKTAPKKSKKETSAYLRGLAKLGPKDAIQDADYSGWMKKKSSNLMTTWKPRLFVLKGRRLAYYYSEEDTEEKGLIDISFHRVLPADNERLTGLHATITGASNSPMAPADSSLQTDADASSSADAMLKGDDAMFIFKLVPPRAGLSRAVNFTKPMVHYFAVPNLQQGRAWMAALMKATIDRDETKPMTSTYQQKTISLAKARQMRHRPPALMNLDEKAEDKDAKNGHNEEKKSNGLGISFGEVDSAISGVEKLGFSKVDSTTAGKHAFNVEKSSSLSFLSTPQSA